MHISNQMPYYFAETAISEYPLRTAASSQLSREDLLSSFAGSSLVLIPASVRLSTDTFLSRSDSFGVKFNCIALAVASDHNDKNG
jgi:hypothetical protein